MLGLTWVFALLACAPDGDFDGYSGSDCDDGSANVHPGALEICNGVDDDCNGSVDDDAFDTQPWFLDADGDSYGAGAALEACERPPGYVATDGDCLDADPGVHPGATEICDGLDDDCDGVVDPQTATGARVWYLDADGDGSGTNAGLVQACAAPPGYGDNARDCDDNDPDRFPGASEVCDDGIENDCDTDGVFDCAAAECGGTAGCGPGVTAVDDPSAPAGLVTTVAVYGAGFVTGTTGAVTVTFGTAGACAPVTIVSDGLLLCDTPKGAPGDVDVTVTTSNGAMTLPNGFTFSDTVFVVDGKGATSGSLYRVDLGSGDIHEIGNVGYGIDGMAFSPDGVLYGVTSVKSGGASLVTLDQATGRATVIGALVDAAGRTQVVPDITFVGSRLVGWTETGDRPVVISPSTGAVGYLGTGTVPSVGGGLLYDASSSVLVFFTGTGALYGVNPTSGAVFSAGVTANGPNGDTWNGATTHEGVAYGIDAETGGGYSGIARIAGDGTVTTIVKVSDYVEGIASPYP